VIETSRQFFKKPKGAKMPNITYAKDWNGFRVDGIWLPTEQKQIKI